MAKILIVEDNADTNEALSEYLQEAGHEIISAYDGTEALELFSNNTVDLIVLDIMLPTMSGLAVLNAVRKTSQIPVIIFCGLGIFRLGLFPFRFLRLGNDRSGVHRCKVETLHNTADF